MQKTATILAVSVLLLLISGCSPKPVSDTPTVLTTIFPLYDFVREIGKDKIQVSMLLPPGTEAHSFEPTPRDIIKINESSLFIYIGESMEPWAHEIIETVKNDTLLVLEAGDGITENDDQHLDEDDDHDEDRHSHSGEDPHIWLDFEIDQTIVDNITEKLAKIDPENRDFYLQNARDYKKKLADLDNKYRETFAKCELNTIMYGGHFAFGHLAKRYGISYISPYEGFTPNAEPSPQKIVKLIETIKANSVDYLYYEELLDPKVAKSISASTGVTIELLHAAHNVSKEELSKGISFLSIMEDNLAKLKKGLKYKE